MAEYTRLNLKTDIDDQAPKFGFAPNLEFRMAGDPLGASKSALSYLRVAPGYRLPFGTIMEQATILLNKRQRTSQARRGDSRARSLGRRPDREGHGPGTRQGRRWSARSLRCAEGGCWRRRHDAGLVD